MSKAVPPADEMTFSDVVDLIRKKQNIGYAAAAQILDSAIESHVRARVIEELEQVKSCFADLQNAEEAVYIESNYIDVRIAQLKETNPHA